MRHVYEVLDKWEFAAWFWDRVDERGEDDCWPWLGTVVGKGYGQVRWGGVVLGAHCAAYELANTCQRAAHVLHSCDNPPCCNPAHLRDGTNQDNVDDRMVAGRDADRSGELNGRHKLTRKQVGLVRREYARELRRLEQWPGSTRRVSYSSLARKYGVSTAAIQFVVQKRNWRK